MSATITQTVGGYRAEFEAEKIQALVSRIKSHRDGRVTAELAITTTAPGYKPHLHQAQLNLCSSPSRKQLAKVLTERYKEAQWDEVLEWLSVKVLALERQGESVVELLPSEEQEPPRFLVPPIVVEDYPVVLFGERSAAKSLTGLVLATILMLPWEDNPLGLEAPAEPMRSLYLDWESDQKTTEWQLARLQKGAGVPLVGLSYRRMDLPLADDLEAVQDCLVRSNARVMIVDSLGMAAGGDDLTAAGPAIALFRAIRKLRVTTIILGHTARGDAQPGFQKSVYGNSHFENLARSIWEVRKAQEVDEEHIDVGLFQRKAPPFSRLNRPLGIRYTFTDSTITIEPHEPRSVREFLAAVGTRAQILDLLADGALTGQEIQNALRLSPENTRLSLKRLRDKAQVVKLPTGKWGLSARYESEPSNVTPVTGVTEEPDTRRDSLGLVSPQSRVTPVTPVTLPSNGTPLQPPGGEGVTTPLRGVVNYPCNATCNAGSNGVTDSSLSSTPSRSPILGKAGCEDGVDGSKEKDVPPTPEPEKVVPLKVRRPRIDSRRSLHDQAQEQGMTTDELVAAGEREVSEWAKETV